VIELAWNAPPEPVAAWTWPIVPTAPPPLPELLLWQKAVPL
jgi:hypothetical protein